MNEERDIRIQDLLGIAPAGRALERVTDSVVGGAEALLSRVCLPAAEEIGLLLRDKVGEWRRRNAVATVLKAEAMLKQAAAEDRHAPPRLIMESLMHASWAEGDEVQTMWGGIASFLMYARRHRRQQLDLHQSLGSTHGDASRSSKILM